MWDSYREELNGILSNFESIDSEVNDAQTLEENMAEFRYLRQQLTQGKGEIDLMNTVLEYIDGLHATIEIQKYHQKRLQATNQTMRSEISELQAQLSERIGAFEELESNYQNLKLSEELRKDEVSSVSPDSQLTPIKESEPSEMNISMLQSQMNSRSTSNMLEIPTRLKTIHQFVVDYTGAGRFEAAIHMCQRALQDVRKNSGDDHPDIATLYSILAMVYRDQGKLKEAAQLLSDAVAIRERWFGPNDMRVALTLNNLSMIYGRRSKFRDAEPLCKRALQIKESQLGKDNPEVAKQLSNLALLCQKQAKWDEVIPYFMRAEAIYTEAYGPASLPLFKTMAFRATAYLDQKKLKDAEEVYKSIVDRAYKKDFGEAGDEQGSQSVWQLAEAKQADQPVGRSLANQAFNIKHKGTMCRNTTVISAMRQLVAIYRKQGKAVAAEAMESCYEPTPSQ